MAEKAKRSGSRKTLNEPNLVALGAERLALVLMQSADEDPGLKRRLRLELAAAVGAEPLAAELEKRFATIETRRSRLHWRKYRAFVHELDVLRALIAEQLAEHDAGVALESMWRLLSLVRPVSHQSLDTKGEIAAVFLAAVADLASLIRKAKPDPDLVAGRIVETLQADVRETLGDLAGAVVPALQPDAVAALKRHLETARSGPPRQRAGLRSAVLWVADAQGDADAFAAALSPEELRQPIWSARLARRLLAAARTEDALAALTRATPPANARTLLPGVLEWESAYLEALEAQGEHVLAQELRWQAFERRLSIAPLRDFLKRLADFDDIEAEDRAMAHALAFPDPFQALRFFTEWPSPAQAAALVLSRAEAFAAPRLSEDQIDVLEPAARLIEGRYPLAASLLLRALVIDAGRWSDKARDRERHEAELASLAVHIEDWRRFATHDAFMASRRR